MTRKALAVLAVCSLLSACGSTVQQSGTTAAGSLGAVGAGGDGLAAPGSADGLTTSGDPDGDGIAGSGSGVVSGPGAATGGAGAAAPGQPGGTGGAAPGTPAADRAPGAGSTAPVKVGIVVTTVAAEAFGVSLGNTVSERQVYEAAVKAMNAKGGLNGRRIVPVFAETSTGSSNWEGDFTRACTKFTQDDKVDVVLGYVFNHYASFEGCLSRKAIPHFNTGFNIPDARELRNYPLYLALDVPTIERRSLAKIDGAVATGYLTGKSRVGLFSDDCPGTIRSRDAVTIPALKRAGITVARTFQVDCVQGYSDSGNASAQVQAAVLAFASERVDRVLFHAVSEGPSLLQFAIAAESQGYRPGYVMSSLANLSTLAEQDQSPREQVRNIRAFGWLPTQDVAPQKYAPPNAAQQRCLALLKSQGITPKAAVDYAYAYNICEPLFLYEQALRRTGGAATGPPVVAAVQALGSSFQSTLNLDGKAIYGAARNDAVASARPLVYSDPCGCFVYTGAARPIPSP